MKKCPKCGSDRVAPILYGMPVLDEETERQLESQNLYLGGCCKSEVAPLFHCFGCGKDVGSPPLIISKRGIEDYREIVTTVSFCDGGYFNGYDEVVIKKTSGGMIAQIMPNFIRRKKGPRLPSQKEMSVKEWNKLIDRLYCKLFIHEWKKQYNDWTILDGEQWKLTIQLSDRRIRKYCGSNAYPPYWNELKQTFKPFFKI